MRQSHERTRQDSKWSRLGNHGRKQTEPKQASAYHERQADIECTNRWVAERLSGAQQDGSTVREAKRDSDELPREERASKSPVKAARQPREYALKKLVMLRNRTILRVGDTQPRGLEGRLQTTLLIFIDAGYCGVDGRNTKDDRATSHYKENDCGH